MGSQHTILSSPRMQPLISRTPLTVSIDMSTVGELALSEKGLHLRKAADHDL